MVFPIRSACPPVNVIDKRSVLGRGLGEAKEI